MWKSFVIYLKISLCELILRFCFSDLRGMVFVGDRELFKFSRGNSKFIFSPLWNFKIQFTCLNLDAISRKCFLLNFSLIRYSLGLFRCYYFNRMSGKFFNFLFDVNFVFFAPGRLKEIWEIFRGIEKIWGILNNFVGSLESFWGKMFGKKTMGKSRSQ